MKLPSKAFRQGFWEGLNPMWSLAWLLWGAGHLISLPLSRWDGFAWLYPAYNRLMLWSLRICERFGFSSPWECNE